MDKQPIRCAIRDRREELGLTQAALAEQARVGRQWLVGLESGRMANPTWASLSAVLDVLGLELIIRPKSVAPTVPDPLLTAVLDRATLRTDVLPTGRLGSNG